MSAAPRRGFAGADDEHRQWRRARRQPDRLSGIHDRAARRAEFCRGAARRRGNLSHAARGAQSRRAQYQCRRRGRLCAQSAVGRSGARLRAVGDRQGRLSSPGEQVALALDPAASEFFTDGAYQFTKARARRARSTSRSIISPQLVGKYPIVSIEDGMAEDDAAGWKKLTQKIGGKCQLVGDDVFVTNVARLSDGIKNGIRQFDPDQGQPDRHAHRNAGRGRDARTRPATPR